MLLKMKDIGYIINSKYKKLFKYNGGKLYIR